MKRKPTSAGGSAMQGGADYQNRVAAWYATKMLAERDAQPLAPPGTVVYLRAETRESVDDLLIATGDDNFAFVQAKRKLSLSTLVTSDLASVFGQCVRQYLHPEEPHLRPWSRKLRPERDRFLLITSSDTPEQLRDDLAKVMERITALAPQQAIDDAALTEKETSALRVAMEHIRREWHSETGADPTAEQTRALLSLLRIVTLDVEEGKVHEREAVGDLRAHVVADSSQERSAWTKIVSECKQTAILRSGISLAQLRSALLGDHIRLQHERGFRSDIQKLQQYTADTLASLDENSAITLQSQDIKINRDVVSILSAITPLPSHVIVGPPGAGKSGVLHDLTDRLRRDGKDVVCIAVDRLELSSAARLREELGLSSSLIDVLKHWDGEQPGYLVIDAFDAARGDTAAGTLLDLIQQAQSTQRWKTLVSVRKYDLRYSPRLRKLFPYEGSPSFGPEHTDSEFSQLNHVKVDALTLQEFNQCRAQWGSLDALAETARGKLLELLHIPFNLRLAAELLDSGKTPGDFAGLQGQTGLLKTYWQFRVEAGTGSGQRERVLRECVASMVSSRRLRTERHKVSESPQALEELLKVNVLSEWQASPSAQPTRQLISFSHNLLFDFAAEQAYLPYETSSLVSVLLADPDLAIVLRPSLHMRFHLLWDSNRREFWSQTFSFCSSMALSPLTQSVPLTVITEAANDHAAIQPLSDSLSNPRDPEHMAASIAYRHLVGILISKRPENLPNFGSTAGPWTQLAEDATSAPEFEGVANALNWLESAFNSWEDRTAQQAHSAGLVSRRIVSFAWAAADRNGPLVTAAIRCVCKTFATDAPASATLLRQAFVPDHLREHGHEELQWIVRSIDAFLQIDPVFVVDLYTAAFSWRDEAEDDTALGNPSRIFGLRSNRRQDYQHALWELDQKFPAVLNMDLVLVTKLVIMVISEHSVHEHHATGATEPFTIDGLASGLLTDYSGIWMDHYGSFGSEPVSMLHTYFRHLDEKVLAGGHPLPRPVFELLIETGHVGAIWRKLLDLALKHEVFQTQLRSAAWAKPLLIGHDTESLIFRFIKTLYPHLSTREQQQVEDTIMGLPTRLGGHVYMRTARDRFLGALEGNRLQTTRAKRRQTRLRNTKLLRLDPLEESRITGGAMPSPSPEILYGWRGVDTSLPSNRRIISLQEPLRAFNMQHMNTNSMPTLFEASALLPDMEAMWCALGEQGESLADTNVLHESFALLVQAASKTAQTPGLMSTPDLATFSERVLLAGAVTLRPEMDDKSNQTFDKQGSWGCPTGRVEAAEGLMFLIVHQHQHRLLHHTAFQALLGDPSALVRSRVSSLVLGLYEKQPQEMWGLLERFARDHSTQVRRSVVHAMDELARAHPERALTLLAAMLERVDPTQPGGDELQRYSIQVLTGYYVWRGDSTAQTPVRRLVSGLPATTGEVANMTFTLRHGMLAKAGEDRSETEALAIRSRSVEIFTLAIDGVATIFAPLLAKLSAKDELSSEEKTTFQELTKLAGILGKELYFAVGAFQEKRMYGPPKIETPEQISLYHAIGKHWDQLAGIGEAGLAHSLTQSLEMFIPIDPEPIFLRVGAILNGSKAWGYQYEQLGFDLVLRIFTTYLAEYPELFQKIRSASESCAKLWSFSSALDGWLLGVFRIASMNSSARPRHQQT